MDTEHAFQLIAIIVLLALSGYFSSAETSLMAINKIRMKNLAEDGNKRAQTVLRIVADQKKMLSAILIGNNIVNLSASALTTLFATDVFGSLYVGVGTGILTFLVLIFGEITPKTAATIDPDALAMTYAASIHAIMVILTPLIFLVNAVSRVVMRIIGIDPDKKQEPITEEELRTIVDISHEEGVIETDEKKMITNVFDFGDQEASEIMIPRVDMICIDVDAGYDEVIAAYRKDKYTRMPVFEEDTDNIIGIINIKDLLLIDREKEFHIRDVMREAFYTFEHKKVSRLLNEMRKSSCNVSVVVNEYGSCVGMITLEDMLEEIVGEIRDEYDEEEELRPSRSAVSENEYLVDGGTRLNDVNELMGTWLASEDYDSIGGYVTGLLGHLPEKGESAEENGLRFVVEEANETRVEKVRIFRLSPDEAQNEGKTSDEKQ